MPPFDPDLWRKLSPYLDEALDVDPEQRPGWLAALRAKVPGIAADLELLLSEREAIEGLGISRASSG